MNNPVMSPSPLAQDVVCTGNVLLRVYINSEVSGEGCYITGKNETAFVAMVVNRGSGLNHLEMVWEVFWAVGKGLYACS